MTLADLPHLTITGIEPQCLTVHHDPSKWVGEGWIAGIYLAGGRFVWGRFRNVNQIDRICTFHPDDATELFELKPGIPLPFIDGYWGERVELVLKANAVWRRVRFEPSDMVRYRVESGGWMATRSSAEALSGGEVIPGGWDHEHCEICSKKLGCGGDAEGYRDLQDCWVCQECFTMFVEPKSLAFIVM